MENILNRLNEIETKYFTLKDERNISYLDLGDAQGIPVLYFHGSPGSRLEALFVEAAARKHGYRIYALDRPGMGRSDFKPKYSLLDYNKDVIDFATGLGIDKFGIIGVSGGGTSLMSLAYEKPQNLLFALDVCGWAPIYKTGLSKDMAPLDRVFSKIARISPRFFKLPFNYIGKKAKTASPQKFAEMLKSSMRTADLELVKDETISAFLAEDIQEAFYQGAEGPSWDAILRYLDWGFKLEDITFPIFIVYGTDDKFVPLSFLKYKQSKLKSWKYKEYPDQGHLYLLTQFDEIFSFVKKSQ